jgi:hypothetical protein
MKRTINGTIRMLPMSSSTQHLPIGGGLSGEMKESRLMGKAVKTLSLLIISASGIHAAWSRFHHESSYLEN